MIRDYYQVVEGKVLDEPRKEFIRVPLVELPPTETPVPPRSEGSTDRYGDMNQTKMESFLGAQPYTTRAHERGNFVMI